MDLTRDNLTIRLRGSHVVVSTDDGASFVADDPVAGEIRSLLVATTTRERAPRSAATLASFAEASRCRPTEAAPGVLVASRRPEASKSVPIGPLAAVDDGVGPLLQRRRSTRELQPCHLTDLATLLFSGARTLEEWTDRHGVTVSHRPHPSAGARHPLSILVLVSEVEALEPGAWCFEPSRCVLSQVAWHDRFESVLSGVVDAVGGHRPPAVLIMVAEPERTLSRYPAGTAHLWRDTGALLATLHLLASSVGLSSCIVGTSGLLGDENEARIDLGALALGR